MYDLFTRIIFDIDHITYIKKMIIRSLFGIVLAKLFLP